MSYKNKKKQQMNKKETNNKKRNLNDFIANNIPDLEELIEDEECEPLDLRNICSFLLIFTPEELTIIATILAIIISNCFTYEEKDVIGSFLSTLASNIFLLDSQKFLIETAQEEQKLIEEQCKEALIREQIKNQKEKEKKEIEDIKNQLKRIEDLLNKQLNL
ncbi:hypothetical protein KHQ81_03570 [Mycoplasmatota bacterium]|nr:hypothetical protein KHQ81_03570 [Mycoplasmatota bacterium]